MPPAPQPPAVASALDRQEYVRVPVADVLLHPENKRRGSVAKILESIRINGWFGVCGRQRSSGYLIWGNHRFQALQEARSCIERARSGEWEAHSEQEARLIESWREWPERRGELDAVPMMELDVDDVDALLILIWDNTSSDEAEWDRPGLADSLDAIAEQRGSLDVTGFTRPQVDALRASPDDAGYARPDTNRLADLFGVPPFSVLDARQGYWQERKRAWLELGIRSELGRPRNALKSGATSVYLHGKTLDRQEQEEPPPNRSALTHSPSGNDPQFFYKKQRKEQELGRALSTEEYVRDHYEGPDSYWQGTSVFDPVLCELVYRWFSPSDAHVLDPFAGGSVRGLVASRLGRAYTGIDLRPEQCAENAEQAQRICRPHDPVPNWHVGDARDMDALLDDGAECDLVFSCPPYFDLESYSTDDADLSNTGTWPAFREALDGIVASACARLRPGRFACFVVGNVRGDDEALHDLQAATVSAFAAAGLLYYNDAILVTALGSVPLRAQRNFRRRKLSRTHQAVLFFLKPPLDDALAACGEVEIVDMAQLAAAVQDEAPSA